MPSISSFSRGDDLRPLSLLERKTRLSGLLSPLESTVLRYSDHFDVPGEQMRASACAMGLEGVVSKRSDAPYRSTRNESWIKSKCGERESFLIGGWRETAGGLQSIALGQMRGGELAYVGKAKFGFPDDEAALLKRFHAVETSQKPFKISSPERKEGQRWAEPSLEAEVKFTGWTASKHIRHAQFLGLREDNQATAPPKGSTNRKPRSGSVQRLLPEGVSPEAEALKAYWKAVGKKALKYLSGRPLTLVRHQRGQVFFHTGPLPATPSAIHSLTIEKREGGTGTRIWVDTVAGLVALPDMDVIEVHPWNATVKDLEHPDQMVLDLDPGAGISWDFVTETALSLRSFLENEYGLSSWPKATGGKGLHLMVPLDRKRTHDQARDYSHRISAAFAGTDRRYTASASLAQRPGRIFIDYLRNGRG